MTATPRTHRASLDPDVYAAERRRWRDGGWSFVGHAASIAEKTWIAAPSWGGSALVTRAADGVLRAFVNACPHRGSRLVPPGETRRRALTCPYHAWTFDHRGALRALPEPDGLPVDRASCGLEPLPIDVIGDLVFVGGSGDVPPLREALGPGLELLAPWERLGAPLGTLTIEVEADWKMVICGVIEDYHLPFVHGRTLDPWVSGPARPRILEGGHSGYDIPLRIPPLLGGLLRYGAGLPDAAKGDYRHALVLPNLTLGRCLGLAWTNVHDPVATGRTVQRFTLYAADGVSASGLRRGVQAVHAAITRRRHLRAFLEDRDIFHEVQAGRAASPDRAWGPVHAREPRVAAFLDAVSAGVGG